MAGIFDKHGIRFAYPENWLLEETDGDASNSVTVYSPEGSFWCLAWYGQDEEPADAAVKVLQALKEDYAETESEPAGEVVEGHEIRGYDVSFYYVDLTNTAIIRAFRGFGHTCVVLIQAEDREFKEVERVLNAITISLMRHV